MVYALALIPVIGLLIFIYFNDKKEKEPIGLLLALFFTGMATVISAIIAEVVGQVVVRIVAPNESVLRSIFIATMIVGPAEELGKFLVLRLITWKNRNFDYSYDAIVYAVFVSLGFALLENIEYVFTGGLTAALVRMFSAVPGHACFAVFMGYFYGKAKYASLTNAKGKCALYTFLSMIVPIAIHGVYDAILMAGRAMGEDSVAGLAVLLWIGLVIALFVVSCILVVRSSKNDFCIVTLPDKAQTVYKPSIVGGWTCECGSQNQFNFCPKCGKQRPMESIWNCPKCGTVCTFKFCGNCGCQRPSDPGQYRSI
ncbi:MAG: PrsW family intramembrane metalloprotease [Clostridiales bacterium]|nr:PrsW family intramembrane metalloprotease [Clostridiales bacterium]